MVNHYEIERMVHGIIRSEHGPDAVSPRPSRFTAETGTTYDGPTDYLQGMRTALETARAAENLAREWATAARGDGSSWRDVAEVLGQLLPGEGEDPAIEAFEWVAPDPAMRFDRVTVSWRCSTCRQRVTDHGPYESHPVDNETGHADECARQTAEVAAWKKRSGWDDE